jgi:hypothetical protein
LQDRDPGPAATILTRHAARLRHLPIAEARLDAVLCQPLLEPGCHPFGKVLRGLGTLAIAILPVSSSIKATSVNVPPMSTPTRHPICQP